MTVLASSSWPLNFPRDCYSLIFAQLDAEDVVACSSVCRAWHVRANDNETWRELVQRAFPERYRRELRKHHRVEREGDDDDGDSSSSSSSDDDTRSSATSQHGPHVATPVQWRNVYVDAHRKLMRSTRITSHRASGPARLEDDLHEPYASIVAVARPFAVAISFFVFAAVVMAMLELGVSRTLQIFTMVMIFATPPLRVAFRRDRCHWRARIFFTAASLFAWQTMQALAQAIASRSASQGLWHALLCIDSRAFFAEHRWMVWARFVQMVFTVPWLPRCSMSSVWALARVALETRLLLSSAPLSPLHLAFHLVYIFGLYLRLLHSIVPGLPSPVYGLAKLTGTVVTAVGRFGTMLTILGWRPEWLVTCSTH